MTLIAHNAQAQFFRCPNAKLCVSNLLGSCRAMNRPQRVRVGTKFHNTSSQTPQGSEFSAGKRVTLYGLALNATLMCSKAAAGMVRIVCY